MPEDDDFIAWQRAQFERWKSAQHRERTVLELYDEWLALRPVQSKTTRNRHAFRRWLEIVFTYRGERVCLGQMLPSQLTSALLITWQNMLITVPGLSGNKLSNSSADQVRHAVSAMFSYAVSTGEMARNLFLRGGGVPKLEGHDKRREGIYTPDQIRLVIANLPFPDCYVFKHTYDTAARSGNIRCLKKSEIDRQRSQLVVIGKGGKRIKILVPKDTLQEMCKLADMNTRSEYVYPNPRDPCGRPLCESTYCRHCDKAFATAGVTSLSGEYPTRHALRHTKAVETLSETGDITLVKRLLTHATIQPTMRYADKEEVQTARLRKYIDRKADDTSDDPSDE